MMPTNLFLVRHGQSEGNEIRTKYEKSGDEGFYSDEFLRLHESQYALTTLGIEQAKKAGDWLNKNNFTDFFRYYVSNNVRAMQTAAYLGLQSASWYIEHNLRERDGGLFNGITPSERDKKYSNEQKYHKQQPFLFRPPQGESISDVTIRIKLLLDTLARECSSKNVIIVCHGHVIRTFRIILERMSLEKANDYLTGEEEWKRVPNCSIVQYTRFKPDNSSEELKYFGYTRMICPAGGGKIADNWRQIERKRFSNDDLLFEAKRNRKSVEV